MKYQHINYCVYKPISIINFPKSTSFSSSILPLQTSYLQSDFFRVSLGPYCLVSVVTAAQTWRSRFKLKKKLFCGIQISSECRRTQVWLTEVQQLGSPLWTQNAIGQRGKKGKEKFKLSQAQIQMHFPPCCSPNFCACLYS